MGPWKSENNPGKQLFLSVLCAAVGLVLAVGFRNFGALGTNAMAGFALGVLLLSIGVVGVLVSGKQTVVVDPDTRRILVEDSNRFGTKKRSIPFNEITDVGIGYLGKRANFVTWYYLVLKLKNGEEYSLFSPGRFFPGGSDRSTVVDWKQRLEGYLGQ